MKKIVIPTLSIAVFIAFLVYVYIPPSAPTTDYTKIEPVVIDMTRNLNAFILEVPSPASCTIPDFATYIASITPNWSNVFSDFVCDLKVKNEDAIFIIQEKKDLKLLFEDGTWSPELDAPHWRKTGPRLAFPIASGSEKQ